MNQIPARNPSTIPARNLARNIEQIPARIPGRNLVNIPALYNIPAVNSC